MELGQQFLVLRYGLNFVDNCIEKHIDVINETGSCWFGKLGALPSNKVVKNLINTENPIVILYSRQEVYQGRLMDVTTEKPSANYPSYYEEFLFKEGIQPSIYFKFSEIEKIEKSNLVNCTIVSSGNSLLNTLDRSMSSFFVAELPEPLKKRKKNKKIEKKTMPLSNDKCVYIDENLCSNKKCVNYGYICERPNCCAKQKLGG